MGVFLSARYPCTSDMVEQIRTHPGGDQETMERKRESARARERKRVCVLKRALERARVRAGEGERESAMQPTDRG